MKSFTNWLLVVLVILVADQFSPLDGHPSTSPKRKSKILLSDKSSNSNNGDGALESELIPIPDNLLKKPSAKVFHDEDEDDDDEEEDFIPGRLPATETASGSSLSSLSTLTPTEPNSQEKHDLLPDVLPTGDPSQYALPVFLKEPSDTFVVRTKPATLHCRVAHAIDIHFQCNSEVVQPTGREDHVEPESGVRYTEARVEISRSHVEDYFGEFHCACVAISGKGSVVSRHALVSYAYLKKQFEVPPYSQQVSKGGQVEVRCHPPKGKPMPTVYWLQNGRKIDPSLDKNFLVTAEGHLILVAARLSDTGNYSCVAENIANTRTSDSATITVYVDGDWSAWSGWSTCSANCGKGNQKRTRTCSNPSPVNGGQPCPGNSFQKRPCNEEDCPGTDGSWSDWSSWSSCSPECFQHRRRTCSNPSPGSGGRYCLGLDLETRNCSDGFCQGTGQLVMYGTDGASTSANEGSLAASTPSSSDVMTQTATTTTQLTLYIVFGVAAVVFIVVVIVIVKLMRRKHANPNGYTLTSTDYGYGSDDSKKPSLGYSPDITHSAIVSGGTNSSGSSSGGVGSGVLTGRQPRGNHTPTTVCYEYSYPDSNSNHSKSGFVRPVSEHHYEQPMVVFPPSQSPSDSIGKPPRSESGGSSASSHHDRGGHSSPTSGGTFERGGLITSNSFPITSTPLPSTPMSLPPTTSSPQRQGSPDPRFTTWTTVTCQGARLTLPDSGVSLTIPPGSLNPGHSVDIFLSVVHSANPRLQNRETLLSPMVVCGPREASVHLKKPVILSLPHCASLRHGHWSVSVHQSDELAASMPLRRCDNDAYRTWHRIVTLGQETINTPVYAQLDINTCHIISDSLAAFALTGASSPSGCATKSIRLAAFAQDGQPGSDLTVRVYVIADTDDALSYVADSERRYNGRLLDKPISVLLQDAGDDLCISVDALNPVWTCQKGADYLEVPFSHIWTSSNPMLHCSFTFRSRDRNDSRLNLSLSVAQKNSPTSLGGKNILKVNCDLSQPPRQQQQQQRLLQQQNLTNNNPPALTYDTSMTTTNSRFRLSPTMLYSLSKLLDPPNGHGNDWRQLAERLNVNRYIPFFATRPSPTESILSLWEARNRELLAVSNLINVLRGMGRFDAAAVLEQDLEIR